MLKSDSFKTASAKFQELGSLAVTAQDHKDIGSTPPQRLRENPDKTLGELMSEQEIAEWVKENEEAIAKFSQMNSGDPFLRSALPVLKTELELGQKYLKSIGRL